MGLRLKFNIVLTLVFAAGMAVSAYVSYQLLQSNAKQEVLRNAGLMMEAALSIRGYTVSQVKPHLEAQLAETFLPQTVPAFAATETFNSLRKKYPDFPTRKPRSSHQPARPRRGMGGRRGELFPQRHRLDERAHRRARHARRSHGLPRAPDPDQGSRVPRLPQRALRRAASMIKLYGENNGFGWKHNEIIGAQIVSVPMALPIHNANEAFKVFMGSLAAIFVVTFIVLNVMLSLMILRPITRMSAAADKVSQGDFDVPEFGKGKDEISVLGTSFNRMRRSLQKALKLIER